MSREYHVLLCGNVIAREGTELLEPVATLAQVSLDRKSRRPALSKAKRCSA